MIKPYPTLTQSAVYRICIVGRVRNGWSDFMTKLKVIYREENNASITELTGTVFDQPALYGLLCHIRDLGLALISVEYLPGSDQGQ